MLATAFKAFFRLLIPGLALCVIIAAIGMFHGGEGDLSFLIVIYLGILVTLASLAGALIAGIMEKIDRKYDSKGEKKNGN